MTMSSPTANGSAGQSKNQGRVDRRREWWTKNNEFKKKLRDRTALSKKENERGTPVAAAVKVETPRGFRSSVAAAAKLTPAASVRSKKPLANSKKPSPPQKARPGSRQHSSAKPQPKVVEKKKPKVVPKAVPKATPTPIPTPPPAPPAKQARVEKAEDNLKPEMISEISMNAYGVDLSGAVNHVPQRYILFVGNLPYAIDKGQLMSHFRKTGGVKSIRIPKDKSGTPKGFAYIEFKDRISHGIALRLHHTTLGGRRINVEFSTSEAKKKEAKDKPQNS